MDLHQKQIDKDAMKRADEMRMEIVPKHLEKNNCFQYEVDWLGISGQNVEAYDTYIMALVVDFYKVNLFRRNSFSNSLVASRGLLLHGVE